LIATLYWQMTYKIAKDVQEAWELFCLLIFSWYMNTVWVGLVGWLLGLLTGSFGSVVISRLRHGESGIIGGRSACPHCKHTLGALDLVPLLSYIMSRWKCRYCKGTIGMMYPLLELAMWCVLGITWWRWGVVYSGGGLADVMSIWWQSWYLLIMHSLLAWCLVAITVYDIRYMEIPDTISLPLVGLWAGALTLESLTWMVILSQNFWILGETSESLLTAVSTSPLGNAMIGAVGVFGFFFLQIVLSQGRAMGGGDLRLAILMGLTLGAAGSVVGLFITYLVGSVVGIAIILRNGRGGVIPFGPFLCVGILSVLWYPQLPVWLWTWMLGV
jgi:prepilin signal peptidase PulO-like enzyme (type II secretory pathway)